MTHTPGCVSGRRVGLWVWWCAELYVAQKFDTDTGEFACAERALLFGTYIMHLAASAKSMLAASWVHRVGARYLPCLRFVARSSLFMH